MWIIFAICSAIFAGLTAILAKCGIKNIDSTVGTAIRTIIVLIFSWIMVFIKGTQTSINSIHINSWIALILSGLATGASWLCYFRALQIGDINKVTPIDKSSTILTMILAIVFLGESITILKLISMILIAIGTYFMIEKKKNSCNQDVKGHSWIMYAAGSAIFASLTSVLGKVGVQNIDSTLGTAIRTVVVLFMAWIMVFINKKQKTIKHIDKNSWLFLILSGIATGVSWICYYRALQTGPASIVVPIDKLSLLITIAFSYIVFKEKLNYKSLIGLVMIVVGTLLLLIK